MSSHSQHASTHFQGRERNGAQNVFESWLKWHQNCSVHRHLPQDHEGSLQAVTGHWRDREETSCSWLAQAIKFSGRYSKLLSVHISSFSYFAIVSPGSCRASAWHNALRDSGIPAGNMPYRRISGNDCEDSVSSRIYMEKGIVWFSLCVPMFNLS